MGAHELPEPGAALSFWHKPGDERRRRDDERKPHDLQRLIDAADIEKQHLRRDREGEGGIITRIAASHVQVESKELWKQKQVAHWVEADEEASPMALALTSLIAIVIARFPTVGLILSRSKIRSTPIALSIPIASAPPRAPEDMSP